VHELGLAIAHSQYQVHGAYVLAHSDIAGFSQQEQRVLASLVRTHRRGIGKSAFDAIPDRLMLVTRRKAALLRLAVLLHRSHEEMALPELRLVADGRRLVLNLPRRWLDARPLLRADLIGEPGPLAALGIDFILESD
jgi:exopolyphosphatase/guanosine-5'-triphosphate,3'-diphosphate pyrophosphatase